MTSKFMAAVTGVMALVGAEEAVAAPKGTLAKDVRVNALNQIGDAAGASRAGCVQGLGILDDLIKADSTRLGYAVSSGNGVEVTPRNEVVAERLIQYTGLMQAITGASEIADGKAGKQQIEEVCQELLAK